ncbi:MAG: hypothetical protein ACE5PM_00865 [Candidatus Hydrothermarchaeales archaeon]
MEEIVSLSMAGIYSLLILNLTFLFLLGIRLHQLKGRIFDVEGLIGSELRVLKERVAILEKALKL